MSGFNQVILLGRLGSAPELRYTQGGTPVVSASLATSRRQKVRGTEDWEEVTSWHRIKAFGKQAEVIAEHCAKGDLLFVEGRLDYWEAESARGAKLAIAEIVVEHFEFANGRRQSGAEREDKPRREQADPRLGPQRTGSAGAAPRQPAARQYGAARQPQPPAHDDFSDDDIPF
jgi:single-strand DNA-binding protein